MGLTGASKSFDIAVYVGMEEIEKEKRLFAEYPFHICMLVKAAKQALDSGRARIENGILILQDTPPPPPETVSDGVDDGRRTKVSSNGASS